MVECTCPTSWSPHCNFVRDVRYSETGWACNPQPHQAGLIFPSWWNDARYWPRQLRVYSVLLHPFTLPFSFLYGVSGRGGGMWRSCGTRVSFETSFDSKQPKLEPKLVSALSDRKSLIWSTFWYFFWKILGFSGFFRFVLVFLRNSLFRLFRIYTKTESFDVSIEPKQTEDQPKQFDREHILVFLWIFRVVSVCFETVLVVLIVSI
jgi:hypothetical protein